MPQTAATRYGTGHAQRDYIMAIIVDLHGTRDDAGRPGAGISDFKEVGLTDSAVRLHLRHLIDDGIVTRTGPRAGRGIRYRVAA